MNGLIRLAVRRPIGVSILFFAITIFGLVSLRELAVDLFPSVEVPQITITTQYEGVAPAEIETLLTRPVEQAVATIDGLERIESTSSEGLSRVRLEFAWGWDLDTALEDVRMTVDRLRPRMPEGADPPSIYKFDLASMPVVQLGVTGSIEPRRLTYLAKEDLSRALERVPGVASVDVQGGQDREIRVALSADRLGALSLSPVAVSNALAAENQTLTAGELRDRGREVAVRTVGELTSVEQIEQVVVATREGRPIRVADLGRVEDTIREIRSELYVDGEPGIRLRIFKQSGANTVQVVDDLHRAIDQLNADYDGRAKISVLWDGSTFIRRAVDNVEMGAALGGLLAAIVLLVFLRSLRSTFVVVVAIPISVIASFSLMFFDGMSLNVISFGGIALGVGMLVDAAIVVIESIYRKRMQGMSAAEASIEGAREVASPVVAGTMTTLAVFVPVVFLGELSGVLFREMALVVTFCLVCSLAVALTFVPMLVSRWSSAEAKVLESPGWMTSLEAAYGRLIRWALSFRAPTLSLAAVLLATSIGLGAVLDSELLPPSDEGLIDIDMELAEGTPLPTTRKITKQVEQVALEQLREGELLHAVTSIGPDAWWRPGGSHQGEVEITLVGRTERERLLEEVNGELVKVLEDVPGAKMRIRARTTNVLNRLIQRGEERLSVEVRGHDLEVANGISERVIAALKDIPGVDFARTDQELGQLERDVVVDRYRAAEIGLGSADVARTLEHYVLGYVPTRLREEGDEYDVRVQLDPMDRAQLAELPSLPVMSEGGAVPLSSLVSFEPGRTPNAISRVNQERVLRIDVGTSGRPLSDVAKDMRAALAGVVVPSDFNVDVAGEVAAQEETFGRFGVGILLAAFLVFAAMAVQFESVRQPLIVMSSVPFAGVGAVLALLLSGTTVSLTVGLGVVVLIGIVVNNAIVLVDAINRRREEGQELTEAIVDAGQERLRPILMTTLTTMLGLLPLALGGGEGDELQVPLARTVVGGLASSTLVTLVLIPTLYAMVEGGRARRVAHG